MWTLFTLTILCAYFIYQKMFSNFRTHGYKKVIIQQRECQTYTASFKGRIQFRFRFATEKEFDLRFHKEKIWDRLCKKVGISNEITTFNKMFDDKIYVSSDIEPIQEVLINSKEIQDLVLKILEKIESAGYKLGYINYHKKHVEFFLFSTESKKLISEDDLLIQLAPLIFSLTNTIESSLKGNSKLVEILSGLQSQLADIFLSLLISGGTVAFTQFFIYPINNLDWWPILSISMKISLLLVFFLLILVHQFLRKSSRFHLVLAISLVGFTCTTLFIYSFISSINSDFSKQDVVLIKSPISFKSSTTSKGLTTYSVFVTLFDKKSGIFVSTQFYKSVKKGDTVTVAVEKGALGFRKIYSVYSN